MIWLNENRDEIRKNNPNLSNNDMLKTAGELWKQLPDKAVSGFSILCIKYKSVFESVVN